MVRLLRVHHLVLPHIRVVPEASQLREDDAGEEISGYVDGGPESVEEPVDSDDDGEHAGDFDADGVADHDDENEGGGGDGGDTDGGEGGEETDDDVVRGEELVALCGSEEDDGHGEVDGGSGEGVR